LRFDFKSDKERVNGFDYGEKIFPLVSAARNSARDFFSRRRFSYIIPIIGKVFLFFETNDARGSGILKMTVDREVTLRMAKAAQLRVPPEQVDHMMDSINDILDFCALVGDLDCTGTPDFSWKMKRLCDRRPDEPGEWADRELFKSSAPTIEGDFFRVPRINAEAL
jgi:aspartyl/glutamyl-tRNA(Asn/Gln) amidotransferase C subunit